MSANINLPRSRFGGALAGLLLLTTLGAIAATSGCGRTPTPGVIVIVLDTVRGDRTSVNGYDRPTTPSLERFAEDAVTFSNAWAPARWTPPSHATLFTGLRPPHHGCRPSHGTRLRDTVPTLAGLLEGAGFATAAFVANPVLDFDEGLYRGFGDVRRLFGGYDGIHAGHQSAAEVLETTAAWIRERRTGREPFLAFVNVLDAHLPYRPQSRFQRKFVRESASADDLLVARDVTASDAARHVFGDVRVPDERIQLLSELYDAELAGLDAALGAFLEDLGRDGLLENTVVVVTSDHGEYLGDHSRLDHMQGAHRAVLHVPLVIRFPGRLDGGRRVSDVVRLEDVVPTILDVCGLPPLLVSDGATLAGPTGGRTAHGESSPVPLFVRAAERVADPATVRSRLQTSRSLVSGDLHLIVHTDGAVELYDLATDPLETRNIAAERPADVERLRRALP